MKTSDLELIKIIKDLTVPFYRTLDFAHNDSHCYRVEKTAAVIGELENADRFLARAGGWLHQYHHNHDTLRRILDSVDLDRQCRDSLLEIVKQCTPSRISNNSSLEAKVVFDADALDLIGSFGMVRELPCNGIQRKIPWDENVKRVQEVQLLFTQNLQTEAGKQIAADTIRTTRQFWEDYNKWAYR